MIEITYDREHTSVHVTGHAHSGDAGHDLVCAAASILIYTLAGNVSQLSADRSKVRRPVIDIKAGDSTVSCDPVHGMRSVVTLIFDSVCIGFELLAKQYPENVRFREAKDAGVSASAHD